MQGILAVVALIVVSVATFFSGSFGSKKENPPPSQIVQPQSQKTSPIKPKASLPIAKGKEEKIAPLSEIPSVKIDTFIKYGPLEREVIGETNKITFEFGANVQPSETQGQLSFETKIEGFDSQWQETYSKERTVDLPAGFKQYAFSVRAKIKGTVDQTPAQRTFTVKVSPYFNKLKISSVRPPTFDRPSLITLTTSVPSPERIKITGWQFKATSTQKVFTIPQGVEKYDSQNPLFIEDIYVKSSDVIYLSGAGGQMLGKNTNFRLNKCFGYLDSGSADFSIPIYRNCPRPQSDRLPRYLSQGCQNYINNREQCELLKYDKLKSYDVADESSCLSYIENNFTYSGCLFNYSNDQDFLGNQWHIYMKKSPDEIMQQVSDTVYLLDQNGLFIDKYKY